MHWLFIWVLNICMRSLAKKSVKKQGSRKCIAISVTVNVNSVTNHSSGYRKTFLKIHDDICTNAKCFRRKVAWESCWMVALFTGNSSITSTVSVESHCLQNGTWTLVDLTCVPNEGFLLNPNSGDLNSQDKNGFLVGLTQNSGNVHSSVSTPVLLIFVVIITVILGMALSTLILVARRWYAKMTFDYSPQHFILATGNR